MHRRTFLTIGGMSLVSLAGCLSPGEDENGDGGDGGEEDGGDDGGPYRVGAPETG